MAKMEKEKLAGLNRSARGEIDVNKVEKSLTVLELQIL